MDGTPGAMTEPAPQQARRRNREQQIHCDHPQTEPHPAVGRRERNDGGVPAECREGIDDRRNDVDREEDERHQRQVAVETGRQKAWPRGRLPPHRPNDSEQDDTGEEDEADDAGAAGRVPEDGVVHAAAPVGSGQRPM